MNYTLETLVMAVLAFAADRSTYKQGRLTPGSHLPIVAAEELAARQPDAHYDQRP